MKSAFKSFQFAMNLMEIHPFLDWMRASGMPFLAKLHTQNIWMKSAKVTKFFSRFTPEHAKGRRRKDGKEQPLKLQLKVLRNDWLLIEAYIRLSFPGRRIGTVRRRRVALPTAMKATAILRA